MFKIVLTTATALLLFTGCGSGAMDESGDYQSRLMNESECDQIIDKEFLSICYDYTYKAAKSVGYTLQGDLVNDPNIGDRPSFYIETALPEAYRAKDTDYTNSGYDRGHLAPDASFDWSEQSLSATYSFANIIPQAPKVNRYIWQKAEDYEREIAVKLGEVNVLNVVQYKEGYKTIGKNQIAVPKGFYKVLYNTDKAFEECFYYTNDLTVSSTGDTLEQHQVGCNSVGY